MNGNDYVPLYETQARLSMSLTPERIAMLTACDVKRKAKELGADLCGIASMDRFEGAPKQQDPRYIFPDAQACIMLAFRIPRGYFRGVEEGTYFAAYTSLGYGGMNWIYMPIVQRELSCFIEDHGYEGLPIPNLYPGSAISFADQKVDPNRSRPVREGYPMPDVAMDFRVAAFLSGLGEIGFSKLFLTPEFGPAQRLVALLTDAPLEPDPLFDGQICDRCMRCVAECSGGAISATETESVVLAGRTVEWGKLDMIKCSVAYRGGNAEYNPFMRPDAKEEEYADCYLGKPKLDGYCGYPTVLWHNAALEGARGCMRACLSHLEEKGVLTKKFVNKFRRRKPWKLPPLPGPPQDAAGD